MTAIMLHSIDLIQDLTAAYRREPSCRVVEHQGAPFAIFRDRESESITIVDIRQLATQIRDAKS